MRIEWADFLVLNYVLSANDWFIPRDLLPILNEYAGTLTCIYLLNLTVLPKSKSLDSHLQVKKTYYWKKRKEHYDWL